MTRRSQIKLLVSAATVYGTAAGKDSPMLQEILQASQDGKKGVMIYVRGQSIAGVVTKLAEGFVELRSREYARIVVKIDSIDGVALS